MASHLKINDLPSTLFPNEGDLFLVSDVEAGGGKTISMLSLNQALSFQQLDGYDDYVSEMSDINDTLSQMVGDFGADEDVPSLKGLSDSIQTQVALESERHERVSDIVSALEDRMANQLRSNFSNIAAMQNVLAQIEERNFQAGLATGYLYAQNVVVGEN